MNTEVKSDNELIAEFMGVQVYEDWKEMDTVPIEKLTIWTYRKNLDYDTNWSRLMPVVEKIQSIDIEPAPNYRGYRIEIIVQGYVKISGFPMPTITTNVANEGGLIQAVYKAVLEFIHWYNSLSK